MIPQTGPTALGGTRLTESGRRKPCMDAIRKPEIEAPAGSKSVLAALPTMLRALPAARTIQLLTIIPLVVPIRDRLPHSEPFTTLVRQSARDPGAQGASTWGALLYHASESDCPRDSLELLLREASFHAPQETASPPSS